MVTLADGRTLRAPLCSYPRLKRASARQRKVFELSPLGVHFPEIDQDISVTSLIENDGSETRETEARGGLCGRLEFVKLRLSAPSPLQRRGLLLLFRTRR